jgi:hypothetical protein
MNNNKVSYDTITRDTVWNYIFALRMQNTSDMR